MKPSGPQKSSEQQAVYRRGADEGFFESGLFHQNVALAEKPSQGIFWGENGWDRRRKSTRNPTRGPKITEHPEKYKHICLKIMFPKFCLGPRIVPMASFGVNAGGIDAENEKSGNWSPNARKSRNIANLFLPQARPQGVFWGESGWDRRREIMRNLILGTTI